MAGACCSEDTGHANVCSAGGHLIFFSTFKVVFLFLFILFFLTHILSVFIPFPWGPQSQVSQQYISKRSLLTRGSFCCCYFRIYAQFSAQHQIKVYRNLTSDIFLFLGPWIPHVIRDIQFEHQSLREPSCLSTCLLIYGTNAIFLTS